MADNCKNQRRHISGVCWIFGRSLANGRDIVRETFETSLQMLVQLHVKSLVEIKRYIEHTEPAQSPSSEHSHEPRSRYLGSFPSLQQVSVRFIVAIV